MEIVSMPRLPLSAGKHRKWLCAFCTPINSLQTVRSSNSAWKRWLLEQDATRTCRRGLGTPIHASLTRMRIKPRWRTRVLRGFRHHKHFFSRPFLFLRALRTKSYLREQRLFNTWSPFRKLSQWQTRQPKAPVLGKMDPETFTQRHECRSWVVTRALGLRKSGPSVEIRWTRRSSPKEDPTTSDNEACRRRALKIVVKMSDTMSKNVCFTYNVPKSSDRHVIREESLITINCVYAKFPNIFMKFISYQLPNLMKIYSQRISACHPRKLCEYGSILRRFIQLTQGFQNEFNETRYIPHLYLTKSFIYFLKSTKHHYPIIGFIDANHWFVDMKKPNTSISVSHPTFQSLQSIILQLDSLTWVTGLLTWVGLIAFISSMPPWKKPSLLRHSRSAKVKKALFDSMLGSKPLSLEGLRQSISSRLLCSSFFILSHLMTYGLGFHKH